MVSSGPVEDDVQRKDLIPQCGECALWHPVACFIAISLRDLSDSGFDLD